MVFPCNREHHVLPPVGPSPRHVRSTYLSRSRPGPGVAAKSGPFGPVTPPHRYFYTAPCSCGFRRCCCSSGAILCVGCLYLPFIFPAPGASVAASLFICPQNQNGRYHPQHDTCRYMHRPPLSWGCPKHTLCSAVAALPYGFTL